MNLKFNSLSVSAFAALALCGCCASIAASNHPALEIYGAYHKISRKEANAVSPYMTSLMAMELASDNKNLPKVKNYLEWYLSRLNYPDKFGLTGTIYDFEITADGKEKNLESYDSADGYSGVFLSLFAKYAAASGDFDFYKKHKKALLDVAYTIAKLQAADGLIVVRPFLPEKYLMDNCEAYGGLTALSELLKKEGSDYKYWDEVRDGIAAGIKLKMFSEADLSAAWALDQFGGPAWTRDGFVYPDIYSRLFLILYAPPFMTLELRKKMWEDINAKLGKVNEELSVEQKIVYRLVKAKLENDIKR